MITWPVNVIRICMRTLGPPQLAFRSGFSPSGQMSAKWAPAKWRYLAMSESCKKNTRIYFALESVFIVLFIRFKAKIQKNEFSEEIKSYAVSAGAHSGVGCFTKCDFWPFRCQKGPKKYAAVILALICCRFDRVLSICVFSGYSGESF